MEKETFEDYLQRLKDRRTEDSYKYTDEDFIQYQEYIKDCYNTNLSVYKCLEFMYFAEREIQPEQIWNEEKKEGVKKLIQKQKLIEIIKSDEELGLYEAFKNIPEPNDKLKKAFRDFGKQETVEQAAERLIPIITRSTPFGSKFEWEPRKERKAFIKGVKWQKEQDDTANEILDYILTNDDGVGIALGYNSREMIEQYFKRINYGK